jgi:hypothetical protein
MSGPKIGVLDVSPGKTAQEIILVFTPMQDNIPPL